MGMGSTGSGAVVAAGGRARVGGRGAWNGADEWTRGGGHG